MASEKLIPLSEIKKKLTAVRQYFAGHPSTEQDKLARSVVKLCMEEVGKIKPVDAAPVVHGRWEEWWPPKHMIFTGDEMLYRCTLCDAKYPDVEGYRCCPYCGARMEPPKGE